ncbi:hypothetical protein BJY52DRAFT_1317397, partial [Lactarius psammicola]
MSFQLRPSAVNKAREIAKRVLSTINLGKLNVWIALMNLKLSTVPKSLWRASSRMPRGIAYQELFVL